MRIAYLSYQRNLDVPGHKTWYTDIDEIEKRGWDPVFEDLVAFRPDIVIEREFNDGRALYMTIMSRLKERLPSVVRAKWFIDSHVAYNLHKMYCSVVDVGFFAIHKYAVEFKHLLGKYNAFWLPLCYPDLPQTITSNYHPIDHEIVFVGRWNPTWFSRRTHFIDALRKRYGDRFFATTDYDNYRSILKRAKVSFNCSISGDLNFRVFETLGCGTELLTDEVEDLDRITGLRERLHTYKTEDDFFPLIDQLLADDPRVTNNMLEAQRWIKERHTITHRMEELLEMVRERRQREY